MTLAGRWLRRFEHRPRASVRLVCLPHAGGAAGFYRRLQSIMPPWVDFIVVQYPGREERIREPCVRDIPTLAAQVARALIPRNELPLALFGHSMGAILAFEVARRLYSDHAIALEHLFVSGRCAPSIPEGGELHRSSDIELIRELKRLNGVSDEVLNHTKLLEFLLPIVRADYQAIETYRYVPGDALKCPLTVCIGDRDPETSREGAERWRDVGEGPFECCEFPGDHFYFADDPTALVKQLAETLQKRRFMQLSS
ncbi:thioesterase II family protein [Arhodomonas sp. AD133]|uniref:thioesterase II family protein n=1 Tax=Arhodomonas sp. AD133 TaxID=3415009 RepID=UPI003EB80687